MLDTRAFRLDWPGGTRLFGVDMSTVVGFKEEVLRRHGATPRRHRAVVPADVRNRSTAQDVAELVPH